MDFEEVHDLSLTETANIKIAIDNHEPDAPTHDQYAGVKHNAVS